MGLYPLAIYTAEHGLSWKYPRSEIDFASLDGCRKAFGGLPDFDAGELGFEGIWITSDRVFAMRCQSVPGWDFRGRDATYLAVTWVTREEAASTDFEALLATPALAEPTHAPQPFFEVEADGQTQSPLSAIPMKMSDFTSVGALVSALPPNASATLRRAAPGESIQVKTSLPRVPGHIGKTPVLKHSSALKTPKTASTHIATIPAKMSSVGVVIIIVCAITTLLALVALGWTVWQWRQSTKRMMATLQEQRDALAIKLTQTREASQQIKAEQDGITKEVEPSTVPDNGVKTTKSRPDETAKGGLDEKETNLTTDTQPKHLNSSVTQQQTKDLKRKQSSSSRKQDNHS